MTSDGTRTYEWDAENRLVAVKEGTTTIASFTHNYAGMRTSKTVGAETTEYVLEGGSVVEERQGGSVTKHFHGPGIDNVLAMRDGAGAVTYLTRDHLGSIREHVDSTGVVTLRRDYDPWGNVSVGVGASGWAFTGREADAATGLQYYRSRYYAAELGRFLSEDPAGLAGGSNRYAYAAGSPIVNADPMGLAPCKTQLCPASRFVMPSGARAAASVCCDKSGRFAVCFNEEYYWSASPEARKCTYDHEMRHIWDLESRGCKCSGAECQPVACSTDPDEHRRSECAANFASLSCEIAAGASEEDVWGRFAWVALYCWDINVYDPDWERARRNFNR